MEVVRIKRRDSFSESLRTLPIGVYVEIKTREYKPAIVRTTISRLRKSGFKFEVTEKGCIDSIKVSRLL